MISERGEKENDKGAEREISGERRCGKEKVVVKVKKKKEKICGPCAFCFLIYSFSKTKHVSFCCVRQKTG